MISILMMGLFALVIIGLVALPITLFSWLMKRNTGYDAKFQVRDDKYNGLDADFLVRQNDNRSSQQRKPKLRKSQATPHYDHLHEMEQTDQRAKQAQDRLIDQVEDDSEPVPLSELVQPDKNSQSR